MTVFSEELLFKDIAEEIGHTPRFLLSEIERDLPEEIVYGWEDHIPHCLRENWRKLSKEARIVAVSVAANAT